MRNCVPHALAQIAVMSRNLGLGRTITLPKGCDSDTARRNCHRTTVRQLASSQIVRRADASEAEGGEGVGVGEVEGVGYVGLGDVALVDVQARSQVGVGAQGVETVLGDG